MNSGKRHILIVHDDKHILEWLSQELACWYVISSCDPEAIESQLEPARASEQAGDKTLSCMLVKADLDLLRRIQRTGTRIPRIAIATTTNDIDRIEYENAGSICTWQYDSTPLHLDMIIKHIIGIPFVDRRKKRTLDEVINQHIIATYTESGFDFKKAAEDLGRSPRMVKDRLAKLGVLQ